MFQSQGASPVPSLQPGFPRPGVECDAVLEQLSHSVFQGLGRKDWEAHQREIVVFIALLCAAPSCLRKVSMLPLRNL